MSALLDRTTPPAGRPARQVDFPVPERHRLANGLTLLTVESRRVPMAAVHLVTPGGSQHNPLGQTGLATMTAGLWSEGTAHHSGREISAAVERLGGDLDTGASWDAAALGLDVPAHELADGLALLAEIAAEASFPAEEVERVRRQRLGELLAMRSRPEALADRHLIGAIYDEDSPYGWPPVGTQAAIEALSRQQIVDFYRTHVGIADHSTLIAVGDFETARLRDSVERLFATLPSAEAAPAPPVPDLRAPAPVGPKVLVVDRPGGAQTALRVGHAGVSRQHPDYLALHVMSCLLGGKFTSRLNLNLRERRGFTYGVHSLVSGRLGSGPIYVATAVGTDVAGEAVAEILHELRRVREEPIPPEELADTRNYLLGTFPNSLQTLGGLVVRLERIAVFGLADDYYNEFLATIAATDTDTVQRVARQHLDPDHAVIVAVGPADTLVPQLKALGPVEVRTVEGSF
jgi:zinc protease